MRKRNSVIWTINRADLQEIANKSNSIRETLLNLGFCGTGGNFKELKKRIELEGIDCSSFEEGRIINSKKHKREDSDVFVENSNYQRNGIKRRIIQQNLIPYKCSECGLENIWNYKEIVLVLDHINGINNDHRLENLRFLCPNCNSQQDTFGTRNKHRYMK